MNVVDVVIIAGYLLLTVTVGIRCGGSQVDDVEYFTGGFSGAATSPLRRWLAVLIVGLSIGATFFSGISMLAYPSQGYTSGVPIALVVTVLPLMAVVIVRWFLPRFFAHAHKQPYAIIEQRMGYPVRAVAAGMYVLLRIGWMSVLIYAPVLAIMAAAQLDDRWFWPLILIIGISSTLYTTLGGLRGVLVTDAIQFLVMAAGVAGPIVLILLDESFDYDLAVKFLHDQNRLNWLNFSLAPTEKFTVWYVLAGIGVA
ncbi:MAG: sodium:solute symporter family transporter, partial [Planctomycetaceae bacterium]